MSVSSKDENQYLIIKDTIDHPVLFSDFTAPTTIRLSF